MTKEELDEALLELINKGLIDVEYNENLEAIFKITDSGREVIVDMIGDDFNGGAD